MKFMDLEPEWVSDFNAGGWKVADRRAAAQGVKFLCPVCFLKNGGPVGTHAVICWSRSAGAPEDATPGPGRWKMEGDDFEKFSLQADPPSSARSVALSLGCRAHFFVTNGEVQIC